MKTLKLFAAGLFLVVGMTAGASAQNLVQDPTFPNFANWTTDPITNTGVFVTDVGSTATWTAGGGAANYNFTGGTGASGLVQQLVNTDPSSQYFVSFDYRLVRDVGGTTNTANTAGLALGLGPGTSTFGYAGIVIHGVNSAISTIPTTFTHFSTTFFTNSSNLDTLLTLLVRQTDTASQWQITNVNLSLTVPEMDGARGALPLTLLAAACLLAYDRRKALLGPTATTN